MLACVKPFLVVFVVPLLSCASFSLLLVLGGMLAHNSDNIWCLPCHPGCLWFGRQQQLYLAGVRQFQCGAESAGVTGRQTGDVI